MFVQCDMGVVYLNQIDASRLERSWTVFIRFLCFDAILKVKKKTFSYHIWALSHQPAQFFFLNAVEAFLPALALINGRRYPVCWTRSVMLCSFWTRCSLIKIFSMVMVWTNRLQVLPKERIWNCVWPFLINLSDLWSEIIKTKFDYNRRWIDKENTVLYQMLICSPK